MATVQSSAAILCDAITSVLKSDGEKVCFSNLPKLVASAMEVAQNMGDLSGPEKKEAVTKAICMAIDRSDVAGPFEGAVLELVPRLCDTLIEVDKGRLVINKKLRSSIVARFCQCS